MERFKKIGAVPLHSSKNGRADRIGIGFEKLDRAIFDPEAVYDPVAELGVRWVRIQSGWARTETKRGVYDFAWLDDIVDRLIARGMEPWICLCYGNPVYTPFAAGVFGAVGCPPIESEEERTAWKNYVCATVNHFKGRVQYYEVWNEPDLGYSWKHSWDEGNEHKPNAIEYAQFCAATGDAIRRTDPNATVIGVAISRASNADFLSTALSTGLGDHIDAVSFHVYHPDDTLRPQFLRTFRSIVDRYAPHLKLVQGEAGAQTRSDGAGAMHGFAWTPAKQTKCLLRGTICDLASDVLFTSYFTAVDMPEAIHGTVGDAASCRDYGYFGVLGCNFDENGYPSGGYSPKPAYTALRVLCSIFSGDFECVTLPFKRLVLPSRRMFGTDCADTTVCTYGFRKPNGASAIAYWNATNVLTTTYEGTISFRTYGMDTSNVRLIDLATGDVYALPEGMMTDDGHGNATFQNLPITDSPLLLTFGEF